MKHSTAAALAHGVCSALITPLWLDRQGLARLQCARTRRVSTLSGTHVETCVRAAHATLRQLARLPRSPWKTTCLYRSVAECVALRSLGVQARLVIGVKGTGSPSGAILAHAWVARDDSPPSSDGFHPLHGTAAFASLAGLP